MDNSTMDFEQENSFKESFKDISNERLVEILRLREEYQPEAARAAIDEALRRKIIESENKLQNKEFSSPESVSRSIFPLGTSPMSTISIFKSLCRIFYGLGLLPLIHAVFLLTSGKLLPGLTSAAVAVFIFFWVYMIDKKNNSLAINILLAINIPAIFFAIYFALINRPMASMDIFAISLVIILMLYVSLYLRKLHKYLRYNEFRP